MSKGIKISKHSTDDELNKLTGARVFQISTPSQKYFGFEIRNFDCQIDAVTKMDNDKLEISFSDENEVMVVYSAVITYELVGLAAIADFKKED